MRRKQQRLVAIIIIAGLVLALVASAISFAFQ